MINDWKKSIAAGADEYFAKPVRSIKVVFCC
jgi:hypothetical protein